MPTTDKELQKQQEKVAKLREDAAQAQRDREERERELANDSTMNALKAEEEALKASIAEQKELTKTVEHRNRFVTDPAGAQAEDEQLRQEGLAQAGPDEAAVASPAIDTTAAAKEK